ncbi:MAG TPA: SAM-dependent methyltransferase, partial [Ignavibacteriaceae bacterium]|nr:SAM-dependent methyltransferase [Ignavibacteriaceae bacterium]
IPLTKRGINESFWVITATTSSGELSRDVYKAADTNAAIVILMGMQKLKEISEIFVQAGKSETPAAIIQNGSMPEEKIGICRVENLEKLAFQKKLGSPAVIIIGEVVMLHPEAEEAL